MQVPPNDPLASHLLRQPQPPPRDGPSRPRSIERKNTGSPPRNHAANYGDQQSQSPSPADAYPSLFKKRGSLPSIHNKSAMLIVSQFTLVAAPTGEVRAMFADDVLRIDEVERVMDKVTSVFVEGDWSVSRLRQRVQDAASGLLRAVDSKLLFIDEIMRNKHVSVDQSLPGYVVQHYDPVVICNGQLKESHNSDLHKRIDLLSARGVHYYNYLAYPVLYPSGKLIAVIQANSRREAPFTSRDVAMLRMLAAFTGKAAANCRLMESLTEAQRKNRVLNKAAGMISSELSVEHVFKKVASLGTELIDADRVTLFVANEDKTALWTFSGVAGKKNAERTVPLEGVLGYAMRTEESLNIKDVANDPRFKAYIHRTGGDGIVDCICVPVKNSIGEAVGVVLGANLKAGRTFTTGDVERLGMLGSYAMISLENSRALDKASHLSVAAVSIMETLVFEDTKAKIEEKTAELVNAQMASVFVHDEDAQELTGQLFVGRSRSVEQVTIAVGKHPVGMVAQTKQAMILGEDTRDLKTLTSFDERFGTSTRNLLILPMFNASGQLIAVIQVSNKRTGAFTNLDASLVGIFMTSAGIALANALTTDKLESCLSALQGVVSRTADIGSALDMDTCLTRVTQFGLEAIPSRGLQLHMVNAKTKALHTKLGGDRADHVSAAGTGLAGYVAESGHTVNIADVETDTRFHPRVDGVRGSHTTNCLAVPVHTPNRDKVVAVLQWLNRKGARRFSQLDEKLAQVFAAIVAVAILNTQTREEAVEEAADLEEQCAKQHELLEIAQAITALPSVDAVAVAITKHATNLLEAARCTVIMVDPDTRKLYVLGADLRPRLFTPSGIIGQVIASGKSCLVLNVPQHSLFDPNVDQRAGCHARSMVCVPIFDNEKQVIGAIQVLNKLNGNFRNSDVSLLTALASLAATSFQRVHLVGQIVSQNELLKAISSDLNLGAVVTTLIRVAMDVFKAEHCRLFMVDMVNSELWTRNWSNNHDSTVSRIPINQGLLGTAAVKACTVNVPDVNADSRYREQDAHVGVNCKSMLLSAITDVSGKVVGVLQLTNHKFRDAFDSAQETFLQQFCDQAAVVLKNSQIFGLALESQEYHRQLISTSLHVRPLVSSYSQLDSQISRNLNLDSLAHEVCSQTKTLLDVDDVWLYSRDPDSLRSKTPGDGWLRWVTTKRRPEKVCATLCMTDDPWPQLKHLVGLAARAVMTGEVSLALHEADETDGPAHKKTDNSTRRARNILSAPVFAADRSVMGLIQINRLQGARPFGHDTEQHLKVVCDLTATALCNALEHYHVVQDLDEAHSSLVRLKPRSDPSD